MRNHSAADQQSPRDPCKISPGSIPSRNRLISGPETQIIINALSLSKAPDYCEPRKSGARRHWIACLGFSAVGGDSDASTGGNSSSTNLTFVRSLRAMICVTVMPSLPMLLWRAACQRTNDNVLNRTKNDKKYLELLLHRSIFLSQ